MTYLDQGHIGTLTDAAGVVWKYYYDADGKRRIKSKTVNGVSSITDNCSYYFYEGEDLICQQGVGGLGETPLGAPQACWNRHFRGASEGAPGY